MTLDPMPADIVARGQCIEVSPQVFVFDRLTACGLPATFLPRHYPLGVAGIPSASLVAIAIILAAVGLPVEAIGVLFVFDRVLDMARTSVNVFGDASCAAVIARLEGEDTTLPKPG